MGAQYNYSSTFLEVYNVPYVKKDQAGVICHHLPFKKKKRKREKGDIPHTVNYMLLWKAPKGTGTRLSLGKAWGTVVGRKYTFALIFTLLDLFTVCSHYLNSSPPFVDGETR